MSWMAHLDARLILLPRKVLTNCLRNMEIVMRRTFELQIEVIVSYIIVIKNQVSFPLNRLGIHKYLIGFSYVP